MAPSKTRQKKPPSARQVRAFIERMGSAYFWSCLKVETKCRLLQHAPANVVNEWSMDADQRWSRYDPLTGYQVVEVYKLRRGRKWTIEVTGHGTLHKKFLLENEAKAHADWFLTKKKRRDLVGSMAPTEDLDT